MRGLAERQARECENSKLDRCRCRCKGTMHGAGRLPEDAARKLYEELPDDDPHHLKRRKAKRGRRDKPKPDRKRFCQGCGYELELEDPAGAFCPPSKGCGIRRRR